MDVKRKAFYIKLLKLVLIWLVLPFLVAMVGITLAVQAFNHQESVYQFGSAIEGAGSYFVGSRLAIVIFIIVYWKEIVRAYGKWRGLNLRQIHTMKKLHAPIAGFLFVIEVMGYLPELLSLGGW